MRHILFVFTWLCLTGHAAAQFEGYSGYAQATNKSEVASSDTGVISKILVREGQFVKAGQPMVQLDDETFRLQVESAKHDANNRAEIAALEKRLEIQQQSLAKLRELLDSGNARRTEYDRETLELEALKSSYQQKLHDMKGRELQYQKARALLEKRTIVAPFDGQVARIHRRVGEFVSPNTPEVVTLVDSTELLAEFQVPVDELSRYSIGSEVPLRVGSVRIQATIESHGVLVDRASQTVTVKVKINNSELRYRTGTDCVLISPY